MGQGLDHPAGRAGRQLGIAVQGDHESDIRQMIRVAHIYQALCVAGSRSIDQTIELFQLPSLALPTDIPLLAFTPGPFPMEKEETLTAVALIEHLQPRDRRPEQRLVFFMLRVPPVRVVREQPEKQVVVPVCQVADLQQVDLGPDRLRICEQRGHDDQGAKGVRNSRRLEIHFCQAPRREKANDQIVHDLQGKLGDGEQRKQAYQQPDSGHLLAESDQNDQGEQRRAEKADP